MKKTKSICIIFILFLLVAAISYYKTLDLSDDGQKSKQKEAHLIVINEDNQNEITEASATKPNTKYVMMKEDGYLVVYYGDYQTKYAYTDIEFSMLPEDIQEEVNKGLGFQTEEELYEFLENYDS